MFCDLPVPATAMKKQVANKGDGIVMQHATTLHPPANDRLAANRAWRFHFLNLWRCHNPLR
jgi:hypothetical protein